MMTVEIRINGKLIDVYAAINRGPLPGMDEGSDMRRYEIQDSSRCIIGHCNHERGDGALVLARHVLDIAADLIEPQ